MSDTFPLQTVAVVGAGVAGSACAMGLQSAGHRVTLFDKSRGVGGRMATRRAQWVDGEGVAHQAEFDHGAQSFAARSPRFRAAIARAETAGVVARWDARIHRDGLPPSSAPQYVARPGMTALCWHWLADADVRLSFTVQRLQRGPEGWVLYGEGGTQAGPFDQVVLAMPPKQAAALLAGHRDDWAEALGALRMDPCWTLMAVTDDVDWPWDAALPSRGPLAWVARNDRKPGRAALAGRATWVAHATPAWSAAHVEETAAAVCDELAAALQTQLPPMPPGQALRWHHAAAHRWRYAVPAVTEPEPWWDLGRGLGVCGDFLGGGDVEGAWRSGDELADRMAAELERVPAAVAG